MKFARLGSVLLLVVVLVTGVAISCSPASGSTNTGDSISGSAAFEMIRQAADDYLSSGKELNTVTATSLYTNLTDGNTSNDPFIISTRTPTLYRTGHICSAVNIPLRSLFLETSWDLLPPKDTNVVLYSETGNEGSEAVSLLNMMGYNVTPLLWGFTSWYK